MIPTSYSSTVYYKDVDTGAVVSDRIDLFLRPGDDFAVVLWPWRPGINMPPAFSGKTIRRIIDAGMVGFRLPRRWRSYRHLALMPARSYADMYRASLHVEKN